MRPAVTVSVKGDFKNLNKFLRKCESGNLLPMLDRCGSRGVVFLMANTPRRTGITASSWYYEIVKSKTGYELRFCNNSTNRGISIAMLIQYGHRTGFGAYVKDYNYIVPSLKGVFKELSSEIDKELKGL